MKPIYVKKKKVFILFYEVTEQFWPKLSANFETNTIIS